MGKTKNTFIYLSKENRSCPILQINDIGYIVNEEDSQIKINFMGPKKEVLIPKKYVQEFDIDKIGDNFDFKICDRCFKRLPTSHFTDNRVKSHGKKTKRPSCKNCRVKKDGKNISQKDRDYWNSIKPIKYTPFSCPICCKTTIVGLSKIVLDHCHKTGNVRGYLCESCNTGIGRFDDDEKLVYRAAKWLEGKIKPE